MQNITVNTIISLHDRILKNDGGDCRIISEGNLHQLVFRANMTGDPISRAATVFWLLCAYPAFREGNRRTAYRLAETLLGTEGCRFDLPCGDVRTLVQGIDAFTVEIEDVEQFLIGHAGKRR